MELNANTLLNYLKTRPIQLINCENLTHIEIISDTYNPFDTSFKCKIKGNNGLLIVIDKTDSNKIQVRVGKDTGWIGGLLYTDNVEIFVIDTLTTESLINGFKENLNNQKYTLCSYSSSSIDEKIMVGTLEEIDKYCLNLSYEKKPSYEGYKGTFKEFYYSNYFLSQYNSKKILTVFAL